MMQIVITISEDDYRKVQDGRASVSMMQKAIRNGTPLEKIRAEIEERKLNSGGEPNRELAFNVCLHIIDKYRAESEDNG